MNPTRPWHSDPITRLMTFSPFVFAVWVQLFSRPFLGGPMFAAPPALFGLPLGLVFEVACVGWAAGAAFIVWTTRSRIAAALAFVLGTVASLLGIIVGPAIVLILQNIGPS